MEGLASKRDETEPAGVGRRLRRWLTWDTWKQPIADGSSSAPTRFGAATWLVFLAIPLAVALSASLTRFLVVLVGCVVISICYVTAALVETRRDIGWLDWRLIPLGILVVGVALTCFFASGDAIYLMLYSIVPAMRIFGARVSVLGVLAAVTVAVGLLAGSQLSDLLFVLLMGAAAGWSAVDGVRSTEREDQTRAYAKQMTIAEERARFARDLHDLLGHSLSVIALKCEVAGRLMEVDPSRAKEEVEQIEGVARRALREVREAVTGYRETTLQVELAGSRSALASARISWTEHIDELTMSRQSEGILAWGLREAVTNAIRHSSAGHCEISLSRPQGGGSRLAVIDDGVGAADGGEAPLAGNGLRGLQERVASVCGQLEVGPRKDSPGWMLAVTLPADPEVTESPLEADFLDLPTGGKPAAVEAPAKADLPTGGGL